MHVDRADERQGASDPAQVDGEVATGESTRIQGSLLGQEMESSPVVCLAIRFGAVDSDVTTEEAFTRQEHGRYS